MNEKGIRRVMGTLITLITLCFETLTRIIISSISQHSYCLTIKDIAKFDAWLTWNAL